MYKIDELITEIHADEAIEIPGNLTKEQQAGIEIKVLSRMGETLNDRQANPSKLKYRRFPGRKRHIILVAAALILLLGLTAFAAKRNEWDITLINFMGINESDVLQMEGGEVLINEKITSTCIDYSQNPDGEEKKISFTSIKSIGDKNSAYLRVNTDYELPENFNEETDYILPETSSVKITYKNIFGYEEIRSFASTYTAFYEEGKLGFLISIENCEDLNKCNVSLKIENLYLYHDLGKYEETDESQSEELLCEGLWETKWTYSYKSNVRTCRTLKRINSKDGEYLLTKIEVSPISIRIEAVRNPKDREREWTENLLEEICYKNGKTIQIKCASSGGIRNGIFIEEFVKAEEIGEVLKPKEIECVKVCGKNVDM